MSQDLADIVAYLTADLQLPRTKDIQFFRAKSACLEQILLREWTRQYTYWGFIITISASDVNIQFGFFDEYRAPAFEKTWDETIEISNPDFGPDWINAKLQEILAKDSVWDLKAGCRKH